MEQWTTGEGRRGGLHRTQASKNSQKPAFTYVRVSPSDRNAAGAATHAVSRLRTTHLDFIALLNREGLAGNAANMQEEEQKDSSCDRRSTSRGCHGFTGVERSFGVGSLAGAANGQERWHALELRCDALSCGFVVVG